MEKENEIPTGRTHRVGTITAGFCMAVFGSLFLLHTLFDWMDYSFIFSFWPLILIGMGTELLLSNHAKTRIIYDKAAVFLLIVMAFFVIGMAAVDVCMDASALYVQSQMR